MSQRCCGQCVGSSTVEAPSLTGTVALTLQATLQSVSVVVVLSMGVDGASAQRGTVLQVVWGTYRGPRILIGQTGRQALTPALVHSAATRCSTVSHCVSHPFVLTD